MIVLAGLGGPLLALTPRFFVPLMIGELAAGALAGRTGLGAVHPEGATISFLSQVGFAMLMLSAGMHLPLRDRRLFASLREGAWLATIVGLLAIPAGVAAAALAGTSHAAVYAVVLASGSAAVLLPALQETGADGRDVIVAIAQVTIADVVTIVSVPIVLQPGRTAHALLGAALVAVAAALLLACARMLSAREWVERVRALSKQRHWALDLRVALLLLFFLAWLAQRSGTSVLIAGFGAGVTIALVGGPKRLSTQIRGIADGFFIPLYFVTLGAQLDLRGLFSHPAMIALAGALALLNVLIHLIAARAARVSPGGALAACAQLGVPAAVASLGLAEHVLSSEIATAIVAASIISLGVCTAGVQRLLNAASAPGASGASGTSGASAHTLAGPAR